MENTNKFILLGLSSFALALTVNYFRKRKNNSNSEERNIKKTDLVKTVTFGPSEIIDENIDESSLIESDLVRRDSAVLSIDGSITAKSDFISCDSEFVRPTEEAELVTNKVETLIEEAKSVILKSGPSQDLDEIEAKSNELKAIVELLAVKADSTMAKIEPMKTEYLNNNSEELNKLVENLKLKEKDMNSVDVSKRTCERDSANNSPSDFSTTNGSIHSDARSESSADGNDSGKGGSDTHVSNGDASDLVAVSPYPSHLITTERIVVYEFLLPQKLCGALIGRYGSNVNDIKTRTGASLLIKKHPAQMKYKICSIEGTKSEIDHALEIVRDKFPSNKYPQVTLEQVNIPAAFTVALVPDTLQDLEGTEHDGDIDDDSDNEGAQMTLGLLYYPHADDTSSDYTVNAMDVEELRRSSWRFKKPLGESPSRPASVAISLTGSQDSDGDEGDDLGAMSTTSGEAVDKNLNMLAASMDAIDLVGKREKYLRNEFETLENPVDSTQAKTTADPTCDSYKNSLSSRFLSRESPAVANATLTSLTLAQQRDPTAAKNREELLRRLEESKKKLQSIGSKSGIKSSQSINDLSRLSDMSSSSNLPSQASCASPANRPELEKQLLPSTSDSGQTRGSRGRNSRQRGRGIPAMQPAHIREGTIPATIVLPASSHQVRRLTRMPGQHPMAVTTNGRVITARTTRGGRRPPWR